MDELMLKKMFGRKVLKKIYKSYLFNKCLFLKIINPISRTTRLTI